jgi:hypothetical protein
MLHSCSEWIATGWNSHALYPRPPAIGDESACRPDLERSPLSGSGSWSANSEGGTWPKSRISDKCLMRLYVNGIYSSRRLIANRELGRP